MTTMNHEWNVGQVGILHGEKGLPMQEQHRDHEEHHLVFLLRYIQHKHICAHSYLCRIGSPGIKVRHSSVVVRSFTTLTLSITMTCSL